MKLKTPDFWYRKNETVPAIEKILTPFSLLYRIGYELHQRSATPQKADIPVVCIGNINAGGTGKTPTALALMETLRETGVAKNPFFLLRGYGGGERGPLRVDPARHDSWATGDEALILAAFAPTIIAADRAQGVQLALKQNADLVLMDDGLQNPGIHKDIKIVVINGEMGFGNGKMIPAGPLREPLEKGMTRADIFILIGDDKRNTAAILPKDKPLIRAKLEPGNAIAFDKTKKYLAFAGLGYPKKFFNFLSEKIGLNIVKTISFSDHHPYTEQDLKTLHDLATKWEAELVTTHKDFLRLPKIPGVTVHTAEVKLIWESPSELSAFLTSRLKHAP
ncbi:MAG: tetraacyldisaccharide 4'-kinase [Alphaproteobacteria bacterium]